MARARDRYGYYAECANCGNEIQLDADGNRLVPIDIDDEPRGYRVFVGTRWRRGEIGDAAP